MMPVAIFSLLYWEVRQETEDLPLPAGQAIEALMLDFSKLLGIIALR